MQWYSDLITKEKVSELGFMTDGVTAFRSGHAAMTIDGSFRLSAFDGQKGLDYGVTELPAYNGKRANFASYWANGITAKAKGEKAGGGGEVPGFHYDPGRNATMDGEGRRTAGPRGAGRDRRGEERSKIRSVRARPRLFRATDFADETSQRQVMMDMMDRIVIKHTPVADAVATAAAEEQKIIDSHK